MHHSVRYLIGEIIRWPLTCYITTMNLTYKNSGDTLDLPYRINYPVDIVYGVSLVSNYSTRAIDLVNSLYNCLFALLELDCKFILYNFWKKKTKHTHTQSIFQTILQATKDNVYRLNHRTFHHFLFTFHSHQVIILFLIIEWYSLESFY